MNDSRLTIRQWHDGFRPHLTAAGPRGIHTLFPYFGVIYNGQHNRRRHQTLSSSIMLYCCFNSIAEASDACERSAGYGTIRTLTLSSLSGKGVRLWPYNVRFAKRSLYPATMSVTRTIKPGECSILISRPFAP